MMTAESMLSKRLVSRITAALFFSLSYLHPIFIVFRRFKSSPHQYMLITSCKANQEDSLLLTAAAVLQGQRI